MSQKSFELLTNGEGEIVNITPGVEKIVQESGVRSGLANIFVTGSTVAVTTIEYEDGVLEDFRGPCLFLPRTLFFMLIIPGGVMGMGGHM
ncbi:MAG: YjbQ family protein [Methanomicrobiales archaeon]